MAPMFSHLPKYKVILRIFLGFFAGTCLILSFVRLNVQGANQATVYISPATQTSQKGQEILVNVNVSEVTDLYSFQITLNYNPDILEFLSVSEGSFLNSGGAVPTRQMATPIIQPGQIAGYGISRSGSSVGGATGSGNLAGFRFRTKNQGESPITFLTTGSLRILLVNSRAQEISITCINGKVIVQNGSPPAPPSNPNEARFNFMNTDHKTLRLKNRSRGDNYWSGAISATPGDKIAFNLYYHNGIEGTEAKNTKIRLEFSDTAQEMLTISSQLTADNVPAVTDSVRINLTSPQKITFDDRANWHPNRGLQNPVVKYLDKKQNSVEINLGNIRGCWEYQGQVIFEATLSNIIPQGALDLNSQVKNLTQNLYWSESISALPNDELYFKIEIKAKDYGLNNIVVRDQLPPELIYQTNSLKVVGASQQTGGLFSSQGLVLDSLRSGETIIIYFKAKVTSLNEGQYNFNHYVFSQADNLSVQQKTNLISVSFSGCSPYLREPTADVN